MTSNNTNAGASVESTEASSLPKNLTTPEIDPAIEASLQFYQNQYNQYLSIVNTNLNTKQFKQKAFARAINAAFKIGLVDENYDFNLQSEKEAQLAGILAKMVDLKFIIMTNNRLKAEKQQGEGNDV